MTRAADHHNSQGQQHRSTRKENDVNDKPRTGRRKVRGWRGQERSSRGSASLHREVQTSAWERWAIL